MENRGITNLGQERVFFGGRMTNLGQEWLWCRWRWIILLLTGEDVGAAGTKALHGYTEGDETPLQGVFLDLLQQCHRHVDVVHCQYSWSHCFICLFHVAKLRKANLALSVFVRICPNFHFGNWAKNIEYCSISLLISARSYLSSACIQS